MFGFLFTLILLALLLVFGAPLLAGLGAGAFGLFAAALAIGVVVGMLCLVFWVIGLVFRIVFGALGLALGLLGAVFGGLIFGGLALLALPILALPLIVFALLVWFIVRLARAPTAATTTAPPALPGASAAV